MFLRLKLTNFRQHTDRELRFERGLIALRGLNEAGKTTVLEAIAYAMFGTTALRESIDDVVSWGSKVSTLKVELDFELNGHLYRITRGKSGAEITFSNYTDGGVIGGKAAVGGMVITGQTETRKFMENLLGVTAEMATKMMMANQAALRGALQEGPAKTSELIEDLADFDLIDRIIHLIEERLPSGNTASLEAQVKLLSQQVEETRVEPLAIEGLEVGLFAANAAVIENAAALVEAQAAYDTGHAAAEAVRLQQRDYHKLVGILGEATEQLAEARKQLPGLKAAAVSKVTLSDLTALRKLVEQQGRLEKARNTWAVLQALQEPADVWEGDRASFDAEVASTKAVLNAEVASRNATYLAYQETIGRKINEKVCAFCKKDLSDVPEVAMRNARLDDEALRLARLLESFDGNIKALQATLATFEAIDRTDRARVGLNQRVGEFIEVLDTTVPASWKWTAGDTSLLEGPVLDRRFDLTKAEAEVSRASRAEGELAGMQLRIADLEGRIEGATVQAQALEPVMNSPLPAADLQLANRVQELRSEQPVLQGRVREAQVAIDHARKLHEQAVQANTRAVKAWGQATADLEAASFHNALIRKLRACRPRVADELWSIVLSSVSYYFGQIRGTKSAVTRADKAFLVDGRGITGLSGSTLDALGLAIRIALTKTFLPNTSFMILDEPAAACDANREANLLGLVSAASFEQVILVTHSDLADAYAAQVVNL
jgi:DNA repair exonuclease SbcCD ATPase subunit